jgi:hypothetical protein
MRRSRPRSSKSCTALRWQCAGAVKSAACLTRKIAKQQLVVGVRADPEPDDILAITNTECPVCEADANRVDRAIWVNQLEPEAWVGRVAAEQCVGPASSPLDRTRQEPEGPPEPVGRPGVHRLSGSRG